MQKGITANEQSKIIGEYWKVDIADWVERGAPILNDVRKALRDQNKKMIQVLINAGVILGEPQYARNLIPTSGRNVLARRAAGDFTYTGEIDYGALGDGDTAFTNASTQLNNEVYRAQADSQAFDENVAYIDWFVAAGDVADQTFEEFGAFIGGSGTADTGQAWSLLITGGWVKSGSLFISARYTFV